MARNGPAPNRSAETRRFSSIPALPGGVGGTLGRRLCDPNAERAGRLSTGGRVERPGEKPVRSLRDFSVLTGSARPGRDGPGQAGDGLVESSAARATTPEAAVDGDPHTRWSSEFSDPQWIAVDLGEVRRSPAWSSSGKAAYAKAYALEVSLDGKPGSRFWRDHRQGRLGHRSLNPTEARWVRMHGTKRGTFGYSLWEFRVFP